MSSYPRLVRLPQLTLVPAVTLVIGAAFVAPASSAPAVPDQSLLGAVAAASAGATPVVTPKLPLSGRTIVVDPGHQLGNSRFPRQINKLVDARGLRKPCNSTGTATNAGFPEATFAWRVSKKLRNELISLGATVLLTRTSNSKKLWGPCVDVRGKWGNKGFQGNTKDADLEISIHGDGSSAGNHGFHVIVSTVSGTRTASTAYATKTRAALDAAGFARSTYIGKGTAFSFRNDLGTINWADMPAVMVELGNMRNKKDAAAMSSKDGRTRYAHALAQGVLAQLTS
ncbi:MAG: hypothetical protein JWO46_1226 [Nocardioidaceae bacterium]|nr:hypothetical protein [Nocardioidaceae bacterium]